MNTTKNNTLCQFHVFLKWFQPLSEQYCIVHLNAKQNYFLKMLANSIVKTLP